MVGPILGAGALALSRVSSFMEPTVKYVGWW